MLLTLFACRKEGLDVKFRTIYTSAQKSKLSQNPASIKISDKDDYTQFGDYLGSITPIA